MKWFLIVVLGLMCVIGGMFFSNKYKKRKDFFNALILLSQKLDVEINYSRERLVILIESLDEKIRKSLIKIDVNFLNALKKGTEITAEILFEKQKLIKQNEQEMIVMFFKSLGRSNVENQSKEIKNFISRFENFHTLACNDETKFGKLGFKLGIISAIAILIILI